jgi:hypothetical protein
VRILFNDNRSAFNIIVPSKLTTNLLALGLNCSLCNWVLDFLMSLLRGVMVGNITSSTLILNTGAPQGCSLRPLLYSLYTYDSAASRSSNSIIRFADDTTVVSLITKNDKTTYREEVGTLMA